MQSWTTAEPNIVNILQFLERYDQIQHLSSNRQFCYFQGVYQIAGL